MSKKASHLSTLLQSVILCVLIFFCSCRKTYFDNIQTDETENVSISDAEKMKFFKYPSTVERSVKRVIEQMKLENDRSGFLGKFIAREGYAVWDKALVKEDRQSRPSNGSASNSVSVKQVLIPLVFKDSNFVHAALSCEVTGDSVYISLLDSRYYKQDHPALNNSLKGRKLSLLLMQLDKEVFGHDLFAIQDSAAFESRRSNVKMVRLLGENDSVPAGVRNTAGRMVSYTVEVCYIIYVAVNQGQLSGCPPDKPCPQYTEERRCDYYTGWYDDGTASPPPVTPGTGGSTGGGGGGGYTNPPSDPPCPGMPVSRYAARLPTDCPPGYVPTGIYSENEIDVTYGNNSPISGPFLCPNIFNFLGPQGAGSDVNNIKIWGIIADYNLGSNHITFGMDISLPTKIYVWDYFERLASKAYFPELWLDQEILQKVDLSGKTYWQISKYAQKMMASRALDNASLESHESSLQLPGGSSLYKSEFVSKFRKWIKFFMGTGYGNIINTYSPSLKTVTYTIDRNLCN